MLSSAVRWRALFLPGILAGAVAFGASILLDRFLGLLHLPSAFANPPLFREVRDNLEFKVRFETNSQGLRYREIPLAKPAGRRRTLVLGDSFVEGVGVEGEQTFSSLLERDASRSGKPAEYINGGLSGAGPKQYRDLFLEVGLRYQPDAVLLCVYANDLVDTVPRSFIGDAGRTVARLLWPNAYNLLCRGLASRAVAGQSRAFKRIEAAAYRSGVPKALVAAAMAGRFNASILAHGLFQPDYWGQSLDLTGPQAERRWAAMSGYLGEVLAECRRRGIAVRVVFIPAQFQYSPESHLPSNPWIAAGARVERRWLSGDCELVKRLRAWSTSQETAFLDLTPPLRRAASSGVRIDYPLDGHWAAAGHAAVAAALTAWLQ